jgi:hypothetical protein
MLVNTRMPFFLLLFLCCALAAFAQTAPAPTISAEAAANGSAVIVNDTGYVPLRPVIEWLYGSLTADPAGTTVTAYLPTLDNGHINPTVTKTLVFTVGSSSVTLPDDANKAVDLGGTILQTDGHTYVPAHGLEAAINTCVPFGVLVEWYAHKYTIHFMTASATSASLEFICDVPPTHIVLQGPDPATPTAGVPFTITLVPALPADIGLHIVGMPVAPYMDSYTASTGTLQLKCSAGTYTFAVSAPDYISSKPITVTVADAP